MRVSAHIWFSAGGPLKKWLSDGVTKGMGKAHPGRPVTVNNGLDSAL